MIARINDPRNQSYFDLLGISPTVSATGAIMGLIEHEVPEHGLVQLLELRKENLEIVEVTVDKGANCQGKRVRALQLPGGCAADLRRPRRQGRDPGRGDPARDRRPGARDPRAGQGGRAPAGPAVARTCLTPGSYRVTGASPGHPSRPGVGRHAGGRDLDRLGADARVRRPHRPRRRRSCRPGVPEAARTVALALGLGMVFLSRGLARRKRRAWQLAVVLVIASAIAHLAKGLDFEEATVHLLLLVALLRSRRHFVAPGDPATRRAAPAGRRGARVRGADPHRRHLRHRRVLAAASRWRSPCSSARSASARSGCGCGRRACRPPSARSASARPSSCRRTAPTASRTSPCAATRATSSRRAAARSSPTACVGGTALVAGDPIGDVTERRELVREFVRVAHAKGWRVAVAGAANEALEDYASIGFKSMYLGDEAVIRPATFSLDGRAIRKVRQSVSRLEKSGYRVEVLSTADADEALRAQVRAVSEEWRGNWPERGLHDGDGRAVPLPGHGARGRGRSRRPRRRVPAARSLAGERGILARVDAPPRRHAERADGVPDHGDGRVGAAARRHRAVAQLRGVRRLPALRRRRVALRRARCAGCS